MLCPITGTGPPNRSTIASAWRSATSAKVVAGSIPGQRLTKNTSKPPAASGRIIRSVMACSSPGRGLRCSGVEPPRKTSGGPLPTAR